MTEEVTLPLDASELRRRARLGQFSGHTAGQAPGKLQLNMVAVPRPYAFDLLLLAHRNPKPMPLVEVLEPGRFESRFAAGSDVRTDIPRYRVWRAKEAAVDVTDAREAWTSELVTFLIGCSFTFETALGRAGIPVRHVQEGRNVPMYKTNLPLRPAGVFSSELVVTMRPVSAELVARAAVVTARYPKAHGAPVHVGDPEAIGIEDLARPDFGDPVSVRDGEIPVFWACGVTPQLAVQAANVPLAITHAPGHMFVADADDEGPSQEVL
jgi:uncharacterized protein YcsI (UPF0317 family)